MKSILSCRIRLARNLTDYPFPSRLDHNRRLELISSVGGVLSDVAGMDFTTLPLDTNSQKAAALMEQRLISPEFASEENVHAVVLSGDSKISIMLCEEDHLRIQSFSHDLAAALESASRIEQLIDESHSFAFSEKYGYITACPTNLGTGLRASALIHLPALTESQSIRRLIHQANSSGIAVRGFYGEGTQAAWGYYQISNSATLGLTEFEIVETLKNVITVFAKIENQELTNSYEEDRIGFEDRIWRAIGILQNAHRIGTQEAMEHLSTARMGASLDLIPGIDVALIDKLSREIWPATLTERYGNLSTRNNRDEVRAEFLRNETRAK